MFKIFIGVTVGITSGSVLILGYAFPVLSNFVCVVKCFVDELTDIHPHIAALAIFPYHFVCFLFSYHFFDSSPCDVESCLCSLSLT